MAMPKSENLSSEKIQDLNDAFEYSTPSEILLWVTEQFGQKAVQISSFGLEDVALFDMYWQINSGARLATLDTWRLPTETYTVIDQTKIRYNVNIEIHQPNKDAVLEMVTDHGFNLFYRGRENRIRCCNVRKVDPLNKALASVDAWITGLRRDQGMDRGNIAIIEWDEAHSNYKINPLANWDFEQVRKYVDQNSVPYNELHDYNYPSIGCAPCTRAVKPGENPRAGRWWWEGDPDAKECGLHVVSTIERRQ